jgi:DNA processing protein
MTETEACIALNMVPRMGPVRLRKLLARFGSPTDILRTPASVLQEAEGVGIEAARSISNWKETVRLDEELARIEKAGVRVLTWSDPDYPEILREIHDPPIALYMLGGMSAKHRHAIGVVGTRKPSHYAIDCAKKLSYQLANAGITIVSGLARGVDTYAHQAALAAKGRTIAVIGSGLGRLYPPENRELADRIAAEGGAVLSEFSMLTGADKQTFPMRNRIISGLSFGLLVVEAGVRSGALISANQAGDQGRSIYAVPGRIDNPTAIGSNKLIQQGAKLVLSAADILDDLGVLFPIKPELAPPPFPEGLGKAETAILEALQTEELSVDEIIEKSSLLPHEVTSGLLGLEIRGLVKNLPGSRFVRLT